MSKERLQARPELRYLLGREKQWAEVWDFWFALRRQNGRMKAHWKGTFWSSHPSSRKARWEEPTAGILPSCPEPWWPGEENHQDAAGSKGLVQMGFVTADGHQIKRKEGWTESLQRRPMGQGIIVTSLSLLFCILSKLIIEVLFHSTIWSCRAITHWTKLISFNFHSLK